MNCDCSEKQGRRLRSLSLSDFEWSPVSRCDQNYASNDVDVDSDLRANGSVLYADGEKLLEGNPESVSSTDDIPAANNVGEKKMSDKLKVIQDHNKTQAQKFGIKNPHHIHKVALKLVFCSLFALVAVFTLLVGMSDHDEFDVHYPVPT